MTPDAAAIGNVYVTLALTTAVQELTRQTRVLAGMVESTKNSLDGVRRKVGSDR